MIDCEEYPQEGRTYSLVARTKDGEVVTYTKLNLGDNIIKAKADESNFYILCKEDGTYTFKADSENAYLGYEKHTLDDEGYDYVITE